MKCMTARDIYEFISAHSQSAGTTICHLHTPKSVPCVLDKSFGCANASQTKVLNLDKVVSDYCEAKGVETCSSTDALSYKDDYLLFIEIKGWRQFVTYHLRGIYDKEKIEKQEQSYDYNKKLEDSISVCKGIILPNAFIPNDKIVYVLVIDTNIHKQAPSIQLLQNLNILANDSSSIYVTINDVANTHLQQSIKRPVRKIRIYCQNFDNIYAKL